MAPITVCPVDRTKPGMVESVTASVVNSTVYQGLRLKRAGLVLERICDLWKLHSDVTSPALVPSQVLSLSPPVLPVQTALPHGILPYYRPLGTESLGVNSDSIIKFPAPGMCPEPMRYMTFM